MSDLEKSNPYPENKSSLRQAWQEGYRAAERGDPLPGRGETPYNHVGAELAWIRGYNFAQNQSEEE